MKNQKTKLFMVFFMFLTIQNIQAQTPLTNRQIFDFSPGDVMQGTHFFTETPGPPIYETYFILNKTESKLKDTLFYKIRHCYYRPPSCQNCPATEEYDTFTKTITNLDSYAIHENKTFQCSIVDTFYYNFCLQRVWEKKPGKLDSNWFEPAFHNTYFVEGLGGPYFHIEYSQGGPTIRDFELTYFSKNRLSCGQFYSGVKSFEKQGFKFKISPNPFSETTVLEFPNEFTNASITIYTINGELVREINNIQGNGYTLNKDNLNSGVYIISVNHRGTTSTQKLLIY